MEALRTTLAPLPVDFFLPILVVQHLHPSDRGHFARHLDGEIALAVSTATDKEKTAGGRVYFAPANYHLFVERDETLALSLDAPFNWSRPSIDILFESASKVWREGLVGIILSGSLDDGARGMQAVSERGGLTVVQDPKSAHNPEMILAVMNRVNVDHVIQLPNIGQFLLKLFCRTSRGNEESAGKESCL